MRSRIVPILSTRPALCQCRGKVFISFTLSRQCLFPTARRNYISTPLDDPPLDPSTPSKPPTASSSSSSSTGTDNSINDKETTPPSNVDHPKPPKLPDLNDYLLHTSPEIEKIASMIHKIRKEEEKTKGLRKDPLDSLTEANKNENQKKKRKKESAKKPLEPPPPPKQAAPIPPTKRKHPPPPPKRTFINSPYLVEHNNYPPVFYPTPTTPSPNLDPKSPRSKYPLPVLPLSSTSHKDHRYNPLISQLTNLFMVSGKKATAESQLQQIITRLRTKGTPNEGTGRGFALLPDCPPLHVLPTKPLEYLRVAIDSLAPLMRLKTVKASGGFTEQVPIPLNQRQRRRTAIQWILTASSARKRHARFVERVTDEIVAVVEGRSSAWDKRLQIHRSSVAARANVEVN